MIIVGFPKLFPIVSLTKGARRGKTQDVLTPLPSTLTSAPTRAEATTTAEATTKAEAAAPARRLVGASR